MKSIKKILLLQLFVFLQITAAKAQESTWNIDVAHSKIGFNISYFKVGDIKGVFNDYEGTFVINGDNLTNTKISITIKAASINTNQEKRDEHLETDEFFNAAEYPEITFTSTSFEKISDEEYALKGNFTMRGITKPLTLKGIYKGGFVHPRFKNTRKVFTITGKIPREDFKVGTNYPPAEYALGKEVDLIANIHLIKQ